MTNSLVFIVNFNDIKSIIIMKMNSIIIMHDDGNHTDQFELPQRNIYYCIIIHYDDTFRSNDASEMFGM